MMEPVVKKGFLWAGTVLLLFLLSAGTVRGQVHIGRMLAIPSDDRVKLEVTLSNPVAGEVILSGEVCSHTDREVIWTGEVFRGVLPAVKDTVLVCHIRDIRAKLWSPSDPNLYDLEIRSGGSAVSDRIGFRRFENRDGRFFLNGKPIFLRGNAINPPKRGLPVELSRSREFARDYIRFMKGMHVNIIRLYEEDQTWLDVCDEEGMMVFGGRYGSPAGSGASNPPKEEKYDETIRMYKEVYLGPYAPHPSVMIYVMTNEVRVSGEPGDGWRKFLKTAYDELIQWDHEKQYICNAGYGLGRSADVYDVHRYWGWYYNTFLTYLNLRDMPYWENEGRSQPITFTECVGNYTGIDGRYNIVTRTKQPGAQKSWTGHLPDEEQAGAALEYQAFMLKQATELFRRMREHNPRLSGIMPFTIPFHHWDGIGSFAEMQPKPAAYQYGISYQPILVSWETWQPNVYTGNGLTATLHVVNDDDRFEDLTGAELRWSLEDIDRMPVAEGNITLPRIPYYGTWREKMTIPVPAGIQTGTYRLKGTIIKNGAILSSNGNEIFIAGKDWEKRMVPGRTIRVYDPAGTGMAALRQAGIEAQAVADLHALKPKEVLVLSEMSWGAALDGQVEALKHFAEKGGRIVCLRQDPEQVDFSWLPVRVDTLNFSNNDPTYHSPVYMYRDGMNVNIERREHPVFEGLTPRMFRLWSDYNGYDESQEGFPMLYPVTHGYSLRDADLTRVQVLANYGRNLAATALSEIRLGKGSVILCGFDLTSRCGLDPVAEKLLVNLLNYACGEQGPEPYLYVEHPVHWGDYASERGIVTGPNNGLIVHTVPVVPVDKEERYAARTDALGYQTAGGSGGWNDRPGVQYMARGRRPFAPYSFSVGGSDQVEDEDLAEGSGYFLARVPACRRRMVTWLENPSDSEIRVAIGVNGQWQEVVLPAQGKRTVVSQLPAERLLKVTFTGDRRTVIVKTAFED